MQAQDGSSNSPKEITWGGAIGGGLNFVRVVIPMSTVSLMALDTTELEGAFEEGAETLVIDHSKCLFKETRHIFFVEMNDKKIW